MKQTALMLLLLLAGTGGAFVVGPFVGIAIYYLFAVLRPQSLWDWALLLDIRWSFFVAIATLVATVLHARRVPDRLGFTAGHAAMLGFAIWVTLSHIFALNAEVSAHWYWEYFKIFTMFFCGQFVIQKLEHVKILYLIAMCSLGYIAYEVNILYFTTGRLDIYHQGYGGLDNNGAGLQIAMGVPMAYFVGQYYHDWRRWVLYGIIPVMLHAVMMTYSRGAMLSLSLVIPLVLVRSTKKARVFLLLGLLLLLPILAGPEIRDRFFSVNEYQSDASVQSRFDSWHAAWEIAKDYPILGVGIRNADLLSHQYGADKKGRTIHSQYLQIAADSGFPSIALYLMVILVSWRSLRRVQKQCRRSALEEDQLSYALSSGIEGALVVFCIGSIFLSLESFELFYLLILMSIALPETIRHGSHILGETELTFDIPNQGGLGENR